MSNYSCELQKLVTWYQEQIVKSVSKVKAWSGGPPKAARSKKPEEWFVELPCCGFVVNASTLFQPLVWNLEMSDELRSKLFFQRLNHFRCGDKVKWYFWGYEYYSLETTKTGWELFIWCYVRTYLLKHIRIGEFSDVLEIQMWRIFFLFCLVCCV